MGIPGDGRKMMKRIPSEDFNSNPIYPNHHISLHTKFWYPTPHPATQGISKCFLTLQIKTFRRDYIYSQFSCSIPVNEKMSMDFNVGFDSAYSCKRTHQATLYTFSLKISHFVTFVSYFLYNIRLQFPTQGLNFNLSHHVVVATPFPYMASFLGRTPWRRFFFSFKLTNHRDLKCKFYSSWIYQRFERCGGGG